MASPFPGVDPYLEAQGRWPGFHTALMAHCSEVLNRDLPECYVAQIDERISLVSLDDPPAERIPDVLVISPRQAAPSPRQSESMTVTVVEPMTMQLVKPHCRSSRELGRGFPHLPEMELVTVLAILSPSNKTGTGRGEYLGQATT